MKYDLYELYIDTLMYYRDNPGGNAFNHPFNETYNKELSMEGIDFRIKELVADGFLVENFEASSFDLTPKGWDALECLEIEALKKTKDKN